MYRRHRHTLFVCFTPRNINVKILCVFMCMCKYIYIYIYTYTYYIYIYIYVRVCVAVWYSCVIICYTITVWAYTLYIVAYIYIYIHISYVYMHMELIGNRCVHVIICVRIIIGLENVLLITCTFLANPLSWLPTSPYRVALLGCCCNFCAIRVPRAPAEPMHQLQLDVFPCAAWSLSIS